MNKNVRTPWLMYLLIIAAGIGLDQWTKYLAVVHLKDQDPIPLIPGVLELFYLENRGAAFGMMQGGKVYFLILTAIVLVFVVYALAKLPFEGKYRLLTFLVNGVAIGAVGNMIDRCVNSYVVDFIYFKLIDFPVFNVADIFVTVSCFIAVALILFSKEYREEDFAMFGRKK